MEMDILANLKVEIAVKENLNKEILTKEALKFLSELHKKFNKTIVPSFSF